MSNHRDQLADALRALKRLQEAGRTAIRSRDLTRSHRERLSAAGYLDRVMKGWYVPARPDEGAGGGTTAWYSSYWGFCAEYLGHRFGDEWSLSPEQSILLHAGNRTVPEQLLVRSPRARNQVTPLTHGTSILELRARIADAGELQEVDGLRLFRLPHALVHSGPRLYSSHPTDARAALATIRDASELLPVLLSGGHSVIAGRLAGALRRIDRTRMADDIVKSMRAAGYTVHETDPFEDDVVIAMTSPTLSPHVHRLRTSWESMRGAVEMSFPEPAGSRPSNAATLARVDEIYTTDAYHSLSIEGYRVSEELIERVRAGSWDPERNEEDRKQRDSMAARGYWLAFQRVKASLARALEGGEAADVVDEDHGDWFRALFGPSVEAGVIDAANLAGYRNVPVYIRDSMHVPPRSDAVLDCMPELFELLRREDHPGVRAVLGHFFFVYIHPYVDGNGRMARFLMNLMLVSGGYSWTVIPVELRAQYMGALEQASVRGDIKPFARLLASLTRS